MRFYDLTFSDGKRCRMIDPDGDGQLPTNFHPGYLVECERIITPPPAKLPWKRDGNVWRIGSFELVRLIEGSMFRVTWPGGSAEGGKDVVSAAVRDNWAVGC